MILYIRKKTKMGEMIMGAYYAYQITNEENRISYSTFNLEKKFRLEKYSVGGMKFLESFYSANPITQALYLILKNIGKPAVVSTVCDYDYAEEFKNQMKWNSGFEKMSFDVKEIGKFLREKHKLEKKYNLMPAAMLGFIVCDSKKQYIDLYEFSKGMTVSPLALLTRSSQEAQGGGDFDISDADWKETQYRREFEENPDFDKKLVSSWKDLEVQFYDDDYSNRPEELKTKLNEYENISKKILLTKK